MPAAPLPSASDVVLDRFHPAVAAWFRARFAAPTPAQARAWPAIQAGRHTLIAAPTGSGKTLAAFLAAIDELVRLAAQGTLPDETRVVYVSPLKALSNDIRINLEEPLCGIGQELSLRGLPGAAIRSAVRTGDTPALERAWMKRLAPHILVTTPESLYVLLGSESGRKLLSTTRSVIVDEVHALAPNKRGSHLALSLERLEALCQRRLLRIGLSATQKPVDEVARFLCGAAAAPPTPTAAHSAPAPDCEIIDTGHVRDRDLAIELPATPLGAVMSGEQWTQTFSRLAQLAQQHRTTLVFVNTRRMAERAARHLSELLGKERVAAHHGSLAKELRLDAEQKLKRGELRVLVATASLELGIDIGDVDLVCQLASPRAIAAFLQRVGRSGHAVGATPKGRLFPQTRDDLIECAALLDAVRRGELDRLHLRPQPVDVLAQSIVAEVACRDWDEDALYEVLRRAWPYAGLTREQYTAVLRMLAEGYTTRRGPTAAYLHRDAVNGVLRARPGARLTALTSGGAIPDTADYEVMLEPQAQLIGSVHEDFAVESMAGDVFQLGNASYRILRVERGRLRVEDAQGAPPSIPFWIGEAPGRSDELSRAVSRLRQAVSDGLDEGLEEARLRLVEATGIDGESARQIVDYLGAGKAALGLVPTQRRLAMERFFDEAGGTQLVIHSPYGVRLNRAWGLALRKRFCRSFNFELQAAATEEAIVLSLSTSHSFPLADVAKFLHANSVRDVLVQALLDAPMFPTRWRWNATTALALPRYVGGRKVAPQIQRMKSEDLLATVFPDQVACLENIVGEREVPDHPLVAQTLSDCLDEAMDIDGLEALLRQVECGEVEIVARDLTAPSPFAAEILSARPYAFLDDAPLEERRTQAVIGRGYVDPATAGDFGHLDAEAIAAVRGEAWPQVRGVEEMHDVLMSLGFVTAAEVAQEADWAPWLDALVAQGRAARWLPAPDRALWLCAERLPQFQALHAGVTSQPPLQAPREFALASWTAEDALVELLRARLSGLGPVRADALAASLALPAGDVAIALARLERDGYVMQGRYSTAALAAAEDPAAIEWCERHLLARIHRYTVGRLRREIEPVEPRDYLRFLVDWQHLGADAHLSGPDGLAAVLAQLEGWEAPAGAWESELLPARVAGYDIAWLDDLCRSGRIAWTRLRPPAGGPREGARGAAPVRASPVVLLSRRQLALWRGLAPAADASAPLGSRAQHVADWLAQHGASFFDELLDGTRLLQTELEDALAELVAQGRVHADSFAGLRALLVPSSQRPAAGRRRGGRRGALFGIADAGRWALAQRGAIEAPDASAVAERNEHVARVLLRRYGVVCWRMLEREAAWLPPWRELRRVYHRLEARGEIRGGRFIAGIGGEQFALPEAVASLRRVRQRAADGTFVCVCGADPLNLVGSVLAGARVPTLTAARVLYRDGVPLATLVAGEVTPLQTLDESTAWQVRVALQRETHAAPAAAQPTQ